MTDWKFLAPETSAILSEPHHHLPRAEEFLYLAPWVQPYAYRIVDKLFAHRTIRCGPQPRLLPRGVELRLTTDGSEFDVGAFMNRNATVGILVIHRGRVVLERYALGLQEHDRWSTMSTIKSMTAMLVGAAIHDGAINSLDDALTRYVPELKGSSYDGVTLHHLLTMSSGARWSEDYADLTSDVNRYSKFLADRVPGGVLSLMASLTRAHAPGTTFLYNTGDTYLLGVALSNAIDMPLADYMSEKIWQPSGMEHDGFYALESEGGYEIGGSRAGMVLRDFGRFALFVLNDGVIDGRRVLPEGWVDAAATPAFKLAAPSVADITHYGYSWWLGDGLMSALGHAGQRIDIFRKEQLIVVTLGAFPEPAYAPPKDHHRRNEIVAFTRLIRATVT